MFKRFGFPEFQNIFIYKDLSINRIYLSFYLPQSFISIYLSIYLSIYERYSMNIGKFDGKKAKLFFRIFSINVNGCKSECYRLEQMSVMKFLVAAKCKQYEIYRRMCDLYREECLQMD